MPTLWIKWPRGPIFQKGAMLRYRTFFLFGWNCTKGRARNILNNPRHLPFEWVLEIWALTTGWFEKVVGTNAAGMGPPWHRPCCRCSGLRKVSCRVFWVCWVFDVHESVSVASKGWSPLVYIHGSRPFLAAILERWMRDELQWARLVSWIFLDGIP